MWHSKRAESEEWTSETFLWWLVFIPILALTGVLFMFWVKSGFAQMIVVPQGVEESLLLDRIVSPGCFSSPALPPQTLDYTKLIDSQMRSCYPSIGEKDRAIHLFLKLKQGNEQQALSTSNWKDAGISTSSTSLIGVSYNNKPVQGELSLGIQAPRK